ncbi:MAG: C10 family peptidase [Candidatus Cryptobacteroides sp.]
MKKILSIFILALMATGSALADDISAEQALQIAGRFVNDPTVAKARSLRAPTAQPAPTLAHSVKSRISEGKDNVYVINLGTDQGFVVVSGEDGAVSEVLGYCDHGSFNYADAPVQFLELLNEYSNGIDSLRQTPSMAKSKSVQGLSRVTSAGSSYPSYLGEVVVAPLLTTKWNQLAPYNNLVPQQSPTGCVPTAVVQVMNYWKWPKQSNGQMFGGWSETGETIYEDFPVHTYDWDNMVDDYEHSSTSWEQQQAVAQLMADIGKAMGTQYGQPDGSSTVFHNLPLIVTFGYQPNVVTVGGNTPLDVEETLKGELDLKRPVLYSGDPGDGSVGHAMVCDGYTKNDYFHFNYGWGGQNDGFYRLTAVPKYCYNVEVWKNFRPYDAVKKSIDGFRYGLKADGTAEILDYLDGGTNMVDGTLVIPDSVTDDETGNQYAVTHIGSSAFFMKGSFSKIILGNNIQSIAPYSFVYSTIDTLVLSDKMEVVPEKAFATTGIKHLTIGENVKLIGKNAFYTCPLTEIVCKSKQVELDSYSFGQTSLNPGDWEKSIVKINKRAFSGASYNGNMPYFENLEVLGDSALIGFVKYAFRIGPKVREISKSAFDGVSYPIISVDSLNPYFAHDDIWPIIYNKNKTSVVIAYRSPAEGWPETVIKMEPGSVRKVSGFIFPPTIIDMEGACKDCSAPNDDYSTVTCPLLVPPVISDATFSKAMFSDESKYYRLQVPPGTEELYAEAPGWRKFGPYCIETIYDYENQFSPLPPQDLNYQMVVRGDTLKATIETGKVNAIRMSENENGEAMVTMSLNGRDDITIKAADIDSITFKPGFVYEDAEVFELNDSCFTVNAKKCSIEFSPTTIDEDAQVCVRNSVLIPRPFAGVTGGVGIDISMLDENGNEVHELSGVAKITIPLQAEPDQAVSAVYFNEQSGEWEPVYMEYDRDAGVATILTDHLSYFGLVWAIDEHTRMEWFDAEEYNMDRLYTFDEGAQKLLKLLESDDPEVEAALAFKDEMGLWQSLGLDVFYQGAVAATEPLFNFKPEAIDNAVSIMGEIGTALTILDVVRADLKGDNVAVASNTLKVLMAKTVGAAASWIGTPVMAASMSLAAFVGVALEKFGTMVAQYKLDRLREAYRIYYRKEGATYTGKQMYRSAKDWYEIFQPAFVEANMDETQLKAYIEQTVRQYCNLYWDDTDAQTWIKAEVIKRGITTVLDDNSSNRKIISDEFFAELMNGKLVSVFVALRNYQIAQAHKRAAAKVNRMAKMMNQKVGFVITDSSVKEGEPSKFAGRKIGFAAVPDDVTDPEDWVANINEEGKTKLGWFTAYALVRNSVPFRITLFDENGEPEKTFDFALDGVSESTVINIDLAKDGVKDDTKHLDNLKLEYTPESVVLELDLFIIQRYEGTNPEEKHWTWSDKITMDDDTDFYALLYGKRKCTELERFFNRHDFIIVDSLSGNFTIGDDIVGKLVGDSASGTFNINTDYKYIVKTAKQWVDYWNNDDGDWAIKLRTLLDGSVKHQIACRYTLRRKQVDDHFEYEITYTGEGVWDHTMRYVSSINKSLGYNGFDEYNLPYLTTDDIDIDLESQGGDVTLEYTTTLK